MADAGTFTVSAANAAGMVLSSPAVLTVSAALANDNFANAQLLPGDSGQVTGNNVGATPEPGEPTHGDYAATESSIWYRWTPTQTGTAVFTVRSTMPVEMRAYTGSTLASLAPVGSNTLPSIASFTAIGGTTYWIAVGTRHQTLQAGPGPIVRGDLPLSWHLIANDDFAHAQILTGDSGNVSGTTDGATNEPNEPVHSVDTTVASSAVWYRWTPSQTGAATLQAQGSFLGLVFSAYTGDAVTTMIAVPGASAALGKLVFPVTAGTTYCIAVGANFGQDFTFSRTISSSPVIAGMTDGPILYGLGGIILGRLVIADRPFTATVRVVSTPPANYQWSWNGRPINGATDATLAFMPTPPGAATLTLTATNANGSATVQDSLTVIQPPPNDNFADAAVLAGTSGSISGQNYTASSEPGEPIHWNLAGTASSVWYRWAPTATGLAEIDTIGSGFDTVLAVYTGASLTTLTRIAQNDDAGGASTSQVNFSATANTTYWIAVGGSYDSARGSIELNWRLTPALAIVTPPASQTIAAGGSATFSVNATGNGAMYQWYRNGVAIPAATSSSLTIGSVQAGDDASYTVTVSDPTGSVTSAPAALAVAATDVTNLTVRNYWPGTGLLWGITGGNGQLIAVGDGGAILASADGQNWVPRNSGTTNWLVAVTYANGVFVAVGDKGSIITSADGLSWTPVANSGTSNRLNNVTYANSVFVAVGEGGTIVSSADGQNWTPRASGVTTWLHGLVYNAAIGQFAACGQNGVFLYSSDGSTWSQLAIPGLADDLEATVAVNSYAQFAAIGANGTCVAVHRTPVLVKDGSQITTWSADVTSTGSSIRFRSLSAGAGALFASGEQGKVITARDTSGPWLTLPSGTTANLVGGTYYNSQLYLVGDSQTIVQSDPLYGSRLINISTRGEVGTGDNILICGFVVTGTVPKPVLIRAAGPALGAPPFNISGTLDAPALTLYNSGSEPIAMNTSWSTASNADAIAKTTAAVGAFPFAAGSGDSALLVTLPPGNYTAQVAGLNNHTGIGIAEVYDAAPLSDQTAQAVNLSTRGWVGSGDQKLIAGFYINGASSRRVLIRAVGPALGAPPFGLPGTVVQPKIELYNSHNLLRASAVAWGAEANSDDIRSATHQVGAFPLSEGSNDSAMLITLLPGAWTVQVSDVTGGSGLAIVEVYVLP